MTVALLVLGTLCLQAAWVLALPPFRGIDEFDHAYKAAAVAHGQWSSDRVHSTKESWGSLIAVPRDLVLDASEICETYSYVGPDNCFPARDLGGGMVLAASGAAHYNPLFYAIVGWPSLLSDGSGALYGMRIVSSLVCLLLLGLAVWAVTTWSNTSWPLVSLLLCLTPTTIYTFSLPAPNGLELAAALCMWSAMIGLGRAIDPGQRFRLLLLAGFAAVPLSLPRLLGPLWWALIVGAAVLCLERAQARMVVREHRRTVALLAVVWGAALVAGIGWTLVSQPNPIPVAESGSASEDTRLHSPSLLLAHAALWVLQSIAAFPTRNEYAPLFVYVSVIVLVAAFLLMALRFAPARLRIVMLLVALAGTVIPVAITLRTLGAGDFVWQGRYTLPLTYGVILLAGLALEMRRFQHPALVPAAVLAGGTVLTAHVASIVMVLVREKSSSPLAGDPRWLEPSVGLVAMLTILGVALWCSAAWAWHRRHPSIDGKASHDATATRQRTH